LISVSKLTTDKKSFLIGFSTKLYDILAQSLKDKTVLNTDQDFINYFKIKFPNPFQLFEINTEMLDKKENIIQLILKYDTKIKNIFLDYYECGSILTYKNPNKSDFIKIIILFM
jgi:hypothetical protein